MFEKVNPAHPDKIADRIAGAMVDAAYTKDVAPRIAVEVLIGHGECSVITEATVDLRAEVNEIVERIAGPGYTVHYRQVPQDPLLSRNQCEEIRCGDNGIFCGAPVTTEQMDLVRLAKRIYWEYDADGKYIKDGRRLIICQSNAPMQRIEGLVKQWSSDYIINPLGPWSGGPNVDAGATNRKLGSDMGNGVTGGGLHGKDLSKADVSVNIYAHLLAQQRNEPVRVCCAIGDEEVGGVPYRKIVEIARDYIKSIGGFEAFADWGLIR